MYSSLSSHTIIYNSAALVGMLSRGGGGRFGGGKPTFLRYNGGVKVFSSSSSSSGKKFCFARTQVVASLFSSSSSSSATTKPKTALVPIANGSEEMETTVIVDVLRRAGCRVTVASCEDELTCRMSRDVQITADCTMRDLRKKKRGETTNFDDAKSSFDAIVVPGGMPGAERLAKCDILDELLKKQSEEKKVIAAMCAAPAVVLLAKGLLATCEASEATAHPAFDLGEAYAKDKKKRVCYSKSDGGHVVITSQGPGTAIEFALALVKELCGEEKRKEVAGPMCVPEDVLLG